MTHFLLDLKLKRFLCNNLNRHIMQSLLQNKMAIVQGPTNNTFTVKPSYKIEKWDVLQEDDPYERVLNMHNKAVQNGPKYVKHLEEAWLKGKSQMYCGVKEFLDYKYGRGELTKKQHRNLIERMDHALKIPIMPMLPFNMYDEHLEYSLKKIGRK